MLYVIDVIASLFILAGFHLAFRQNMVRTVSARVRSWSDSSRGEAEVEAIDSEDVASVLRIAGVMIMAFSFTAAAFANLLAYYTAAGAG